MDKKMIAGIAAAAILLGIAVVNSKGVTPALLEENAKRSVADIANEEVTYLDSEAVALASVSDSELVLMTILSPERPQVILVCSAMMTFSSSVA